MDSGVNKQVTLGHVMSRIAEFVAADEIGKGREDFLEHCDHYVLYRSGLLQKKFPRNPDSLLNSGKIEIMRLVINARYHRGLNREIFHEFVTGGDHA